MTQTKHMQLFFVDPLNQSFLLAESDSLSPKDSPVTHARSPSCTRCSLSHPHRLLRDHAGHSGRGAGIFAPVEPTWGHQAASASPLLQGRQGLQRPSDLPPAATEAQKQRGLQELGSTGATPPSAPPSLQGSSCTIMPQPLPLGDVPATESLPRCEQVPRTSAEADSGGFPR